MRSLHCRDAGFDCEKVIRANSDEELLKQAAQHAREVHKTEPTPEMEINLKALIREE